MAELFALLPQHMKLLLLQDQSTCMGRRRPASTRLKSQQKAFASHAVSA